MTFQPASEAAHTVDRLPSAIWAVATGLAPRDHQHRLHRTAGRVAVVHGRIDLPDMATKDAGRADKKRAAHAGNVRRCNATVASDHPLDSDLTAIGISWQVFGEGGVGSAGGQVGQTNVLPENEGFAAGCIIPVAVDATVVRRAAVAGAASRAPRDRPVGTKSRSQLRLVLIAGKRPETVLIAVGQTGECAKVIDHVLDLGAVDQLPPLQYAPQEQSDDDEDNGNLDEGKTRLLLVKGDSRVADAACTLTWCMPSSRPSAEIIMAGTSPLPFVFELRRRLMLLAGLSIS